MASPTNINYKSLLTKAYVEVKTLRSKLAAVEAAKSEPTACPLGIAIIGMGCRFPQAPDLASFWALLRDGKEAICEVPPERWDWRAYYDANPEATNKTSSRWGGFLQQIDHFDPLFFNISPREAKLMDPQQRLFLEVAWETLAHAGYTPAHLAESEVGVFVGSSHNGYYERIAPTLTPLDHAAGVGNENSIIANRVSFAFNLRGPSILVDTICSSSLVALHLACQSLHTGECDAALVGGVNVLLSPEYYVAMSRINALSPTGRCKPFDHQADGVVLGEGAGAVLLKPLRNALADGNYIHAVIKGSAVKHDGATNGLTASNPRTQAEVISRALEAAGISANEISYIEANGSSTLLGDQIEIAGLMKVFGQATAHRQPCAIGSLKSNIGHLEPASGIAQLLKVVLAMQHRQLPPSLHIEALNPSIHFDETPFEVNRELRDWQAQGLRRAGISSFGIGGTNAHLIVEEAPLHEPRQGVPLPASPFQRQRYWVEDTNPPTQPSRACLPALPPAPLPTIFDDDVIGEGSPTHPSSYLRALVGTALEFPAAQLDMQEPLTTLGFDSLMAVRLKKQVQEDWGVELPMSILLEGATLAQLAERIEEELGEEASERGAEVKLLVVESITHQPEAAYEQIPVSTYQFDHFPEYRNLQQTRQALGEQNPFFRAHEGVNNNTTEINGHTLINYSSYNYIGMSGDPIVMQATKEAIEHHGTSVSASRLISGEIPLHGQLESELAELIGAEASLVYVGGHATNVTTIGHLLGPKDLVLYDELIHNSILQGALMSGASRQPFPHNDWQALDQILTAQRHDYRRVLVIIEGVYSMDGDIPELPAFIEVKTRHKALLMIDEAHSIGTIGPRGGGIGDYFAINPADVDIWMGTLSKSFASCGGYIAGSHALIDYLKYTAPGFVYSVGMSPPNTASALAAVRLLNAEPERVARLQARAKLFLQLAGPLGLNIGMSKDSPVVPVIIGDSAQAMQLSQALYRRGISVMPIIFPAVPDDAARLRFFISSTHTEKQIRFTVETVAEEWARIKVGESNPA